MCASGSAPLIKFSHVDTEDETRGETKEMKKDQDSACARHTVPVIICGLCDDASCQYRCTTCSEYLCRAHGEIHNKERGKSNHNVVTIKEFMDTNPSSIVSIPRCELHPGHQLKFYCRHHSLSICLECIALVHATCERGEITVECQEAKKQLQSKLDALRSSVTHARRARTEIEKGIDDVKSRRDALKTCVVAEFDDLTAAIAERRERLMVSVDAHIKQKTSLLEGHRSSVDLIIAEKDSVIDEMERILGGGTQSSSSSTSLLSTVSSSSNVYDSTQHELLTNRQKWNQTMDDVLKGHPELRVVSPDINSLLIFEHAQLRSIQALLQQDAIVRRVAGPVPSISDSSTPDALRPIPPPPSIPPIPPPPPPTYPTYHTQTISQVPRGPISYPPRSPGSYPPQVLSQLQSASCILAQHRAASAASSYNWQQQHSNIVHHGTQIA